MKGISVLIPFLNEEEILQKGLNDIWQKLSRSNLTFEMILIDSGSQDRSLSLTKEFCQQRDHVVVLEAELEKPSIARAFGAGIAKSNFDCLFFLPIDLSIENVDFAEMEAIESKNLYCVFSKHYIPSSFFMQAYGWMQNQIRTRFFRNFVWTNGLIVHKQTLDSIEWPDHMFLDDVILSDRLKKVSRLILLKSSLGVNSRKYKKNGSVKQALINLTIMTLYRLGLKSPEQLRKLY